MIREFILSLRTTSPVWARSLGYVYASVALESRAKRCAEAWENHLKICHQLILDFSASLEEKKSLVILGSGPCLDIPVEKLLAQNRSLILMDAVHPISVKKKWKKNSNVEFVEADLSGYTLGRDIATTTPKSLNTIIKDFNGRVAGIVSANIISQLALNPYENHCKKNHLKHDDSEFSKWGKNMGEAHLELLENSKKPYLLYYDYERIYRDPIEHTPLESVPSAFPLIKSFSENKKWEWLISPTGEMSKDYEMTMQMISYEKRP